MTVGNHRLMAHYLLKNGYTKRALVLILKTNAIRFYAFLKGENISIPDLVIVRLGKLYEKKKKEIAIADLKAMADNLNKPDEKEPVVKNYDEELSGFTKIPGKRYVSTNFNGEYM